MAREEWAKPRGRKSHPRRCGIGDRGEADLRPSHAIRGRVARGPAAVQGKDLANIARPPQEAGLLGRRKRSPRVQMGVRTRPGPDRPTRSDGSYRTRQGAPRGRSARTRAVPTSHVRRSELHGFDESRRKIGWRGSRFPGSRRWHRRRRQAGSNALPGIGRRSQRHARPRHRRHNGCAGKCNHLTPALGRNRELREAACGMISGHGGRHGKEQCKRGANDGRAQPREGGLSDNEGEAADDRGDDDRCERPRAAVVGGKARGHAGKLCGVP